MSDKCQAVTWANEKERKRDLRHRRIGEIKMSIRMASHKFWWRFLYLTRLAGPYSKSLCRFNLYGWFPDGRCKYCGVKHNPRDPRAKGDER